MLHVELNHMWFNEYKFQLKMDIFQEPGFVLCFLFYKKMNAHLKYL